ncbi:MAG: adenylate cyclase [Betaproteobacteria bacterium]|nr:MAG: adenylate cyclase [Betaproteobacteria bacterium]
MTPETIQRRLAAIFATDIVGFSRLMGADEEATLARLKALRAEVIDPAIAAHQGRIFKTTGDGLLAEFTSVVAAVQCAAKIQIEMATRGAADPPERRIVLRIGINLGDIIIEGDDVYGDGVNIAARLESICETGGVAISASAYEQVRDKITYRCVDRGAHTVKNIARPVHVYALDLSGPGSAAAAPGRLSLPKRPTAWRRTYVAVALLLIAAVAGTYFAAPETVRRLRSTVVALLTGKPAGTADVRAAIAVLPFANQSGGDKRDYFSDGITEDIINALGRFSGVMVIARNAVQEYKNRNATREEISRELGVRYIVQGSVREADGKLRVAVELSDAASGTLLWSERYDGEGKQVFEIQDRIVKNIVGTLAVKLTRLEQKRVFAKPTESLQAYDLVLRARALISRSERGANREAREMLEQALKLAPKYAEAYVHLAAAELQRAGFGWTENPEASLERGESLARQALALEEPGANARAHALLSRVYSSTGQFDRALVEADSAIQQNVSDAFAYALRGEALLWLGRLDESIAASEAAHRFDPRIGPDSTFSLAMALYAAKRYREALATADSGLAQAPEYSYLHAVRAAALGQLGNTEEARKAADQVRRFDPFFRVEAFGTRFVDAALKTRAQEGLRKAGL